MRTNKLKVDGYESAREIINNPVFDKNIDEYALELYPEQEIRNLQPLPNQFVYIINVVENKVIFCSNSIEKLTGYKTDELTLNLLLSSVHPDDKHACDMGMRVAYLYGQNPKKGSTHNFLKINYRLRKKNGEYMHILRYSFLVNEDKSGHMVHYKSVCTDITDIKNDNRIDVKIFKDETIIFSATSEELDCRFKTLTKREREISNLLSRGFSSNEIANKVFISRHTVDTHRRNIIKKLGLKSTNELLGKE